MTNAFWPAAEVLWGAALDEEAWEDGPLASDVVIALLPAIRALFLLGYQVATINTTETTGSGQSVRWWSLDLQTLAVSERPLRFDRPRRAFNIAFDLDQLNDGDELTGDGYGIPLPPERLRAGSAEIRLRRARMRSWEQLHGGQVGPQGTLLDPRRARWVQDEEVPRSGAVVERSWPLGRWRDGSLHVWLQRRQRPGRGERSSGLRWDRLLPDTRSTDTVVED